MFGGSVGSAAAGSTVVEKNLDRITVTVAVIFASPTSSSSCACSDHARRRSDRAPVPDVVVLAGAPHPVDPADRDRGDHRRRHHRRPPRQPADQCRGPARDPAAGGHGRGTSVVHLPGPWDGFNPNTPAGASSSTSTLLTSVLPSAYVMTPKLVPQVNTDLLESVEAVSTSPSSSSTSSTPRRCGRWGAGDGDDFIYAWQSQRATASTWTASPTRWRPHSATATWPRSPAATTAGR